MPYGTKENPQPGMPFINLVIGGVELNVIPNFLTRFTHELRADGKIGKATIELFDPTWELVEDVIINGRERAVFQYGWRDANRNIVAVSMQRKGRVMKYQPSFQDNGVTLNFEIVDTVIQKEQEVESREFDDKKISDIVWEIFHNEPYNTPPEKLHIEVTDGKDTYTQKNKTDMNFIRTELLEKAVSGATGRGGYLFRVDGDEVYFCTPEFVKSSERFYIFQRGRFGQVLDFAPEIRGAVMLVSGGGHIRVEGYDPLKKSVVRTDVSLPTDPTRRALADETIDHTPKNGFMGRYYAVPFVRSGDVEAWAMNKYQKARSMAVKAPMTIIGDPTVHPFDLIYVLVLKPSGDVHYTSGMYRVMKVSNEITPGSFETKLDLISDGTRVSDFPNEGIKNIVETYEAESEPFVGPVIESEEEATV
jgi:hypothetical protein